MPIPQPELDALYVQVHKRLVESGEWDRIHHLLASKLSESGWTDDLRHRTKERARVMDPLTFQALLEEITPQAKATVPLAVKREVTNAIKGYVKEQFEK
ncbi:hypothetical protein BV22DRAFT_1068506 [Leucogyrophana mollusca]|uniref:Uncharacterized protein n=1 Tax=Leucogyrophana mollusca TaxID=85980 RepID=A0ACB8BDS5_9AGAM|nr:hypothetical protein BV22DRAFT_1068506 [Leucogyrophana mollusca]